MGTGAFTMQRPVIRWAARATALAASVSLLAACATPNRMEEVLPSRFVEPPQISAAAETAFGKGAAEAYTELTEWSMAQWLRDPLLDPKAKDSVNATILGQGITDHMIPGTADRWQEVSEAAIGGDENAQHVVQLLRFHNWVESTLVTPGGSPIESQAISNGRVDVGRPWADGTVPMVIAFEQTARIQLLNRRDPYPATVNKKVMFSVVPSNLVTFGVPDDKPTNPAPTSSVPTPESTSPTGAAGRSGTPSIGTLQHPGVERNPDAKWLIATFDGDIELDFDKAATEPPAGPAATTGIESTVGVTPTADATE